MDNLALFCADVGSIKQGNFGWAAKLPGDIYLSGTDIDEFAREIADQLQQKNKVALGYECPLFVPVRNDPVSVNSSRNGEGSRSWSAGAGTGALATGLVEVIYVFNQLTALLETKPPITFDWSTFEQTASIFLWEAFVTSTSKGKDHADDAKIAISKFIAALPMPFAINAIQESDVFSLIGGAALRTGWSDDIAVLQQPCLVIKA